MFTAAFDFARHHNDDLGKPFKTVDVRRARRKIDGSTGGRPRHCSVEKWNRKWSRNALRKPAAADAGGSGGGGGSVGLLRMLPVLAPQVRGAASSPVNQADVAFRPQTVPIQASRQVGARHLLLESVQGQLTSPSPGRSLGVDATARVAADARAADQAGTSRPFVVAPCLDRNSVQVQRMLYREWTADEAWADATFQSVGLQAEMLLVHVFSATAHLPSPCRLRTAMCSFLLHRLTETLGSLRGTFNVLLTELLASVYSDFSPDLPQALRDKASGGERTPSPQAAGAPGCDSRGGSRSPTGGAVPGAAPDKMPSFMSLTVYADEVDRLRQQVVELQKENKALQDASVGTAGGSLSREQQQRLQTMAEENAGLRRLALRSYFTGWRRTAKGGEANDNALMKVITAAKGKTALRNAFRQWRFGVHMLQRLERRRINKRLGVEDVTDMVEGESTDDEDLGQPHSAQPSHGGAAKSDSRLRLPSERSPKTERTAAKLPSPAPAVPKKLELARDYSSVKLPFLFQWLNFELVKIEKITKAEHATVHAPADLRDLEALSLVCCRVAVMSRSLQFLAAAKPHQRADALFRCLTSTTAFEGYVTPDLLLHGSDHYLYFICLELFKLWAVSAVLDTNVLFHVVGFDPDIPELIDVLKRVVFAAATEDDSNAFQFSYEIKTFDDFKPLIAAPCVRESLDTLRSELEGTFMKIASSSMRVTSSAFCNLLINTGIVPDTVSLEVAHIAHEKAQHYAAAAEGRSRPRLPREGVGLTQGEFAYALAALVLWTPAPDDSVAANMVCALPCSGHMCFFIFFVFFFTCPYFLAASGEASR